MITSKLQENLESTFEQGITSKDSDLIARCLRTYALIDKTSHAEEMFKHQVVKPFVDDVINEAYLAEHDLSKVCADLLKFVAEECQMIIALTSAEMMVTGSAKNDSVVSRDSFVMHDDTQQTVNGFDFLVNSVWVEIAQAFEENLPLIFSPGNPDSFLAVSCLAQLDHNYLPSSKTFAVSYFLALSAKTFDFNPFSAEGFFKV